jgi:hypothetical protein
MMNLWFRSRIPEAPILVGALEEVDGAPDKSSPSEPFSELQARLCPSELYCCSPRTEIWYSVTVANLKPIHWRKDALDGLVVEAGTKDILGGLVEQHKKRKSAGIIPDFMPDKGEVLNKKQAMYGKLHSG